MWGCFWRVVMSRIRLANVILKFIYENTNLPMCTSSRRGPAGARRSGQSSTAPAGDRLSTRTRALLNGLKVLSRAALFRSPGYVAELRRKRFRSARRRRANFGVRPIWNAGRTSASGPMTRRAAAQNLGPLGARSRALHNGFAPSLPRRRWAARPRQRQCRWPATRGAFE